MPNRNIRGCSSKQPAEGRRRQFPFPEELRVEYAAYLNGLGDVVGELRRHVLDLIRKESFEKAEIFLGIMENIHAMLMDFDYPDAITRGLRRKPMYPLHNRKDARRCCQCNWSEKA